jgi:iron-sulfur cluster assembly accessory protein
LKALAEEQGLSTPRLRLGTIAGTCSGHQYAMRLEREGPALEDLVFPGEGVEVLVDRGSYPLLQGAAVDYESTLMRAGFVVRNPNAASHCTCGRSFQAAGESAALH